MASPMRLALVLAAGLGLLAGPGELRAQEQPATQARHQILTLDWDRLYEGSAWGQRVVRDVAEASRALNTENNRIADALVAEERALTEQRATMELAAFRAAAEAFDKRATEIRAAQKAKAQALQARLDQERGAFIQAALPILDELLVARGAAIVLDRRVIIRGLADLDVTAELVRLVDERVGDGAGVVSEDAAPETSAPTEAPMPVPEPTSPAEATPDPAPQN